MLDFFRAMGVPGARLYCFLGVQVPLINHTLNVKFHPLLRACHTLLLQLSPGNRYLVKVSLVSWPNCHVCPMLRAPWHHSQCAGGPLNKAYHLPVMHCAHLALCRCLPTV